MDLPYMKFWTQRFFGSIRVQALRGEHRLIYLGLLVAEWGLDGRGLPNDLGELGRILGIPEDTVKDAWGDGETRVSQFFEVRNGRLFNETLETTLGEEKKFRRARSSAGKLGNKRRWQRSQSDRSAIASRDGVGDGDVHQDGEEGADGGRPSVIERLCDEFFFGTMKARELFGRWAYTHEDLNAWLQFEGGRGNGTRLRNHLMKSAKHPDDVKPFDGGKQPVDWTKVDL